MKYKKKLNDNERQTLARNRPLWNFQQSNISAVKPNLSLIKKPGDLFNAHKKSQFAPVEKVKAKKHRKASAFKGGLRAAFANMGKLMHPGKIQLKKHCKKSHRHSKGCK